MLFWLSDILWKGQDKWILFLLRVGMIVKRINNRSPYIQ